MCWPNPDFCSLLHWVHIQFAPNILQQFYVAAGSAPERPGLSELACWAKDQILHSITGPATSLHQVYYLNFAKSDMSRQANS